MVQQRSRRPRSIPIPDSNVRRAYSWAGRTPLPKRNFAQRARFADIISEAATREWEERHGRKYGTDGGDK